MKVAILKFNSRVSPRFEFAPKVLVATVNQGKVIERKEYSLRSLNPMRKSTLLSEQGVNVLICGGINGFFVRLLMGNGIEVIPMVSGEAEEVLNKFINGNLDVATTTTSQMKITGRHRGRRGRCRGKDFIPQ